MNGTFPSNHDFVNKHNPLYYEHIFIRQFFGIIFISAIQCKAYSIWLIVRGVTGVYYIGNLLKHSKKFQGKRHSFSLAFISFSNYLFLLRCFKLVIG